MAVMASGFNGQSFAFHGYLPVDAGERAKKLKQLEARRTRKTRLNFL
jgi:16S rRNA (cytidine1402-2'-O)-methyltransferase